MSRARRLVILGAAGDLTGRFLLPALAHLLSADRLSGDVEIVGVDRADLDDDGFRARAAGRLAHHAPELDQAARDELCRRLAYRTADVTEPDALAAAVAGAEGPIVFYLALPPSLFEGAMRAVLALDPDRRTRLVVEKPFGVDLASARRLNQLAAQGFAEDRVFRIDHFLGMQTTRNLLGIRFANRLFAPLWSAEHIASVDIVWDETVALEGRAGYYDRAGAVRDMVQNHLLQLLALTAMEQPADLGPQALRDAKVAVLRRVRHPSPAEVAERTVRARYTAGRIGERSLPNYTDEPGVDPDRGTETYAEVVLFVDDDRWRGVPFRLRTGKALGVDRHEVCVRFRPTGSSLFDWEGAMPVNRLALTIDPDGLTLDVAVNDAAQPRTLRQARLSVDCGTPELPTYARLLLDVLEGDPTFAIRGDEAEESWRVVEPILAAWQAGAVPLLEYPAGSEGPPPAGISG